MTVYDECMANGWRLILFDDASGHARDKNDERIECVPMHEPIFRRGTPERRIYRAFCMWSMKDDEDTWGEEAIIPSYAAIEFHPDKSLGMYYNHRHRDPNPSEATEHWANYVEAYEWFIDHMWD